MKICELYANLTTKWMAMNGQVHVLASLTPLETPPAQCPLTGMCYKVTVLKLLLSLTEVVNT
jgi:hypothetical protein